MEERQRWRKLFYSYKALKWCAFVLSATYGALAIDAAREWRPWWAVLMAFLGWVFYRQFRENLSIEDSIRKRMLG